MKPPVIPVRSGNFIYSCVAGTSVGFFSQPASVCCHLRSRLSWSDTSADCGVLSLLRVVQALLSQVGPPSRTWSCPLRHDTVFLAHPLLSIWLRCSFSPTLSRVVFLTPASILPRHLARHTRPGLWGQFQAISPCSCHSPRLQHSYTLQLWLRGWWVAPLTLFNWKTPTCLSWVSPGSPPLWSLSGLHHLPKLRRTGSFCFLCLPEEFYPRVPPASGLSSHGDAFRLALLPPFIWVLLQEIPNLRYRFTPQGNQSWPVQPQEIGSASVLHYIGSNCERADSSTRI